MDSSALSGPPWTRVVHGAVAGPSWRAACRTALVVCLLATLPGRSPSLGPAEAQLRFGGDLKKRRVAHQEHVAERRLRPQALTVAAVMLANGGETFAVWVSLFAIAIKAVVTYMVVFVAMTAPRYAMGSLLVSTRLLGPLRHGAVVLLR